MLLSCPAAQADVYWSLPPPQSGNWSAEENWSGGLPGTNSDAYVTNGGTAIVNSDGPNFNELYVGNNVGTGAVQMLGGSFTGWWAQYIGHSAVGSFAQSGGSNSSIYSLYLGYTSLGDGSYNLSNTGSLHVRGTEIVGHSGTGTFTHSGGSNLSGGILLGAESNSKGVYDLSGSGVLQAELQYVGVNGTGTFKQSAGSNTVNSLFLGVGGGSNGTYNLRGGNLIQEGAGTNYGVYVGRGSTGTFTQSGGTHQIGTTLYVGYYAGSQGTYNLSDSGNLFMTSEDSVRQYGFEHIGYSGTGSFFQSGGGNAASYLVLGYKVGSSGTYELTGTGQLSASYEYVGWSGTGSLTQSGGINQTGLLYLASSDGGSGAYDLSGTAKLLAGTEYVGYYGNSTFTQSGGTNTANDLYIGMGYGTGTASYTQSGGTNTIRTLRLSQNARSSAKYELNGGDLVLAAITTAGTPAFNFGGGTLKARGSFTTSLPMALTGIGGTANVDTAGYAVELSGRLTGSGGLNKRGAGSLTLSAVNSYSGDTNVVAGSLTARNGVGPSPGSTAVGTASTVGTLESKFIRQNNLTINDGSVATITTNNVPPGTGRAGATAASVSSLSGALNTNGSGALDLKDNDLIVRGAAGTTEKQVEDWVRSGYHNGSQDGPGIRTTAQDAMSGGMALATALGVEELHLSSFDGQPLSPGDIIVKYTYAADADLNGQVDSDDYSAWITGLSKYNMPDPGGYIPRWIEGNFDGNSVVDGDDYSIWITLLDSSGMSAADGPTGVATPEPSIIALVAMAALGWIASRRRL